MKNNRPGFLKDLIKLVIIPNLINKPLMMYFGANYSSDPGEGYGYGLAATIVFFLGSVAYFLWTHRNYEGEGEKS